MGGTKIVPDLQILALLLLCLAATTSPSQFIHDDYTRFADVERQCQSVLSSGAGFSIDAYRAGILMHQLSFTYGDWSQDAGQAPLMPFDGSRADTPAAGHAQLQAVSLASFMLTHVDTVQRRGAWTALNISGFLSFTITRGDYYPSMAPRASPEFELQPGHAQLYMVFEGVYTETRSSDNDDGWGGERVLCMVGNAVLPKRSSNSSDPWDWAKSKNGTGDGEGSFQPPVTADGNILLMLRYQMENSLTNRAVLGQMTSTNAKSDSAYFDAVRLVSRLSRFSSYHFRLEKDLALSGCSKHQSFCDDGGVAGNDCAGHLHRGASFCKILEQYIPDYYGGLDVVPDWRCNSTDEFCTRLGPFETAATGRAFARSAVAVQDLLCEPTLDGDADHDVAAARVSAVFRAMPPWEHHRTAAMRTGLSGMTLSAEGLWRASTGRLCMVGCLGIGEEASCKYRVSLRVATTFSITRRGIIMGEITSTNVSHSPPLTFQLIASPSQLFNRFGPSSDESVRMVYRLTKVEQASKLLRRREPSGFRDSFIARSLLRYPTFAGTDDDMTSLSNLAQDLSLHLRCVPKLTFLPDWIEDPVLNFSTYILSAGPLVGLPVTRIERNHGVKKHQMLNVLAYLSASSERFSRRVEVSMEGVYNPENGRMYLIGCRNIEAPRHVVSRGSVLEDGMDCSIEVTVEYPSMTTLWPVRPVAKVYVASTRDADDPLFFNGTELRSLPISYRDKRDMITEHTVEKLLCIAMLTAAIAATVSQLRYIESHADAAPYVSLAMLGVQALGYCVMLITDAEMLPAWPNYNQGLYIGCSVKALTMVALFVTARLAQKVWRARARAAAAAAATAPSPPLEPGRVPSDAAVLLYTLGLHLGGLFFVLALHLVSTYATSWTPERAEQSRFSTSRTPERPELPTLLSPAHMRTRAALAARYLGVVKEWFLLPQVIGNAVWRVNGKPLGESYYAGVTAVWLLPHVYGGLRQLAVVNEYPQLKGVMDFYATAYGVVVPVVGIVLALAVYAQQRWNYKIVAWAMMTEQNKLQHAY
ncbi:hypothetical protein ACP70R_005484 [Stipagrostis hirtigluma subsp. patula]